MSAKTEKIRKLLERGHPRGERLAEVYGFEGAQPSEQAIASPPPATSKSPAPKAKAVKPTKAATKSPKKKKSRK